VVCAVNSTFCNAVIYSVTNVGLVTVVCHLVVENVRCFADSCDKRLVGVGEGDMRLCMNLFLTCLLNIISVYLHGCWSNSSTRVTIPRVTFFF